MKIKSAILVGISLLLSAPVFGQIVGSSSVGGSTTAPAPMTEKEVLTELKKDGPDQLVKDVNRRGVEFEMDAEIEKHLRHAKASDEVINAVKGAGPKERSAAATAAALAAGEIVIPPDQNTDFRAVQSELDPDKCITLAEDFAKKYPQSTVLSYIYALETHAYQMKNDAPKTVEFAEKSLAVKKDNVDMLMTAANVIPTPQYIQLHKGEEEQLLNKAESYCQQAVQALDQLKKPANMDDATFAKEKTTAMAGIHASLGLIHYDRASQGLMGWDKDELAKAEKEFQQAVTITDHPDAADYYRYAQVFVQEGKIDDAIAAFTKASELGQGVVKQYAEKNIEILKQQKAQSTSSKQ
jgi:tetratricopeptide (TPR) repeat protein